LPENFEFCEPNSILVLDDLMNASAKHAGVTDLYTTAAHHKNLFVIVMQQNLLFQSREMRTRHLNTAYMVLFKNPRDKLQIDILGQQIYPSKKHFLLEIFQDATREPHAYLLIDLHQKTPELIRSRSMIYLMKPP